MGTLDAPLRKVSQSLVQKFGTTVTITYRATTAGTYDPDARTSTTNDTTDTPKAVVEKFPRTGPNVLAGDLRVIVAAADLAKAPAASDQVTIGAKIYQVVDVSPVYSGDQVAIYEIQARR